MRIMIDGMNLALEQGTGVATYSRNLAYCIKANGHDLSVLYGKPSRAYPDPLLRETVFFDQQPEKISALRRLRSLANAPLRHGAVEIPRSGMVLIEHLTGHLNEADRIYNIRDLWLAGAARSNILGGMMTVRLPIRVDIAHWTYPLPIRVEGAKNIYTIHDMVPIKLPYATLDSKRDHYRVLKNLAATADHLVTVSEASKADIVEMLGVDESFVTNTYQSVRLPPPPADDPDGQQAIDLNALNVETPLSPGGFYLFVGALEPKKNLKRIIEGYLSAGVEHPLLIVGRKAWKFKEDVALIERARNIHYLDYVPFHQLLTLFRSARAVVFPSLYEGFGLPVLEAFQSGAPVITAAASSTGEIAGDAALLVDPYSTREIRDAFRALSAPGSEERLKEMAAAGLSRAAHFTEDRVAALLEETYARVLAG